MPDITMCEGKNCPTKHQCYRHTAFPNEYRQAYFVEPPHQLDGCSYFMRMEEHDYEKKRQSD